MMDQFSPKSSPVHHMAGARSSPSLGQSSLGGGASVGHDRTAEGGSGLKMTISLKQKMPFYLLRQDAIPANETTGATNLMAARGLEHSYNKLTSKLLFKIFGMRLLNDLFISSQKDEGFLVVFPSQHAWIDRFCRVNRQQLIKGIDRQTTRCDACFGQNVHIFMKP